MWPLQRAERAGLLALNVPYFTMRSDGDKIQRRDRRFRFRRCRVRVWIAHGRVSEISMQRTLLGRSRSSGRIPGRLSRTGKTAPNITPKQLSRLPATSATTGNLDRGSRCSGRTSIALRHSPRCWRRLDRTRLAGRFRGFSADRSWSRPLQWRLRHRDLSRGSCRCFRAPLVRGTGARGARQSSQEPERPKFSAHGPLFGNWRGNRLGLDRLCADRVVDLAAGRTIAGRRLRGGGIVYRRYRCRGQSA